MSKDSNNAGSGVNATIRELSGNALKIIGCALAAYVFLITAYGYYHFSQTRDRLLTHGVSESAASFVATAVLLLALAVPALSILRIFAGRGTFKDFAFALSLPLVAWLISLIPANFDPDTGSSLRYCAARPDGTDFCLDRPGVDPLTRRQLVPLSEDSADIQFRRQKGLDPKRIVADVNGVTFFDPLSGQARIYFGKTENGCMEIFDNPGVHPQSGERLFAATKELVNQLLLCKRREVLASDASKSRSSSHAVSNVESPGFTAKNANAQDGDESGVPRDAKKFGRIGWERLESDRTVPVGVWSIPLDVQRLGCKFRVLHKNSFRVESRVYGSNWTNHVEGGEASNIRFMSTEPGMKPPAYYCLD